MFRELRRVLAVLLLPLALFAGTSAATDMFRCSMDGLQRARCCCPSTWATPSDVVALDSAPCCVFETLELASQAPTPRTPITDAPAPVLIAVGVAAPVVSASFVVRSPLRRAHGLVASATGPPLYLRNRSLLC